MPPFKQFLLEYKFTLKYHDTLNPKLWVNDALKPGLAKKFIAKGKAFAKFAGLPESRIKDIVITGGNVNYNYTNKSDIDIHVIADISGFEYDDLFQKKKEWSQLHPDKVAGYPLELYIQPTTETPAKGQGVYSVLQNKWLTVPKKLDRIEVLEDPFVALKMDYMVKYVKQLIKSGSEEHIRKFREKMRQDRSVGLHKKGEYSLENIIFKELRNKGWLRKLSNRHKELKSL